jgi:hypothetical protein
MESLGFVPVKNGSRTMSENSHSGYTRSQTDYNKTGGAYPDGQLVGITTR